MSSPLSTPPSLSASSRGEQPPRFSPCHVHRLPPDVLVNVLQRADLPSRLAAACVCTEWRDACRDPALWRSIVVPASVSFRLWDEEFASLVRRCRGQLSSLDVQGSGITGKSLARLLQAGALSGNVEHIRFDHCCNLKLNDILQFVRAAAAPVQAPSALAAPAASGEEGTDSETEFEEFLTGGSRRAPRGQGERRSSRGAMEEVMQAPEEPSRIGRLHVDGCKQVGAGDVQALQRAVGELDVSVCACGRVGVLQRCSRGLPRVGPHFRGDQGAHTGHLDQERGDGGDMAPVVRCAGLCVACAELFKGFGRDLCGACRDPRAVRQILDAQALHTRLRIWRARQDAMTVVRSRWTDFRHGVQLRPLAGNA